LAIKNILSFFLNGLDYLSGNIWAERAARGWLANPHDKRNERHKFKLLNTQPSLAHLIHKIKKRFNYK